MNNLNQHLKRAVTLGTVFATIFSLAACGGGKSSSSSTSTLPKPNYTVPTDSPAWKADKSKDNTLTWYVNADWWDKSWGEDIITEQIQKDLNLKVVFATGDNTKLNTYFASGDLPDIVTTFDMNSQPVKTAQKWALPLSELADKYAPDMKKSMSKDTLRWWQASDGKTYGYPSYSNTEKDYKSGRLKPQTGFIVRKDVLDAVGKDVDFKTPEGFVAAMKTIKQKFPDLVPFGVPDFSADGTSSLGSALQDMLGVPITTKDGKYNARNEDKEYLTWLKTFRQVHQDGNMSDDTFADDKDTFDGKLNTGKYATLLLNNVVNHDIDLQTWASANPDKIYTAVDAVQSTSGRKPTLGQSGISGFSINFISKKTKNPAKATQLFEYLLSDYGQMLVNFGLEGKTYTKNSDGTVSWTPEANKIRLSDPKTWQKKYRIGQLFLLSHDRYKALNKEAYSQAIRQIRDWGLPYLTQQFLVENISPDPATPEARAKSAIDTKWKTTLVSMVRAGSDGEFDSNEAAYQTFLKENNIDGINKIRNEKIAQNKKKLGQ